MDFTRVEISRSEFKDLKSKLLTQHLYVEVVMVDQDSEGGNPMLYQLNKDKLSPYESMDFLRQEFIDLPHPAFSLLGNIVDINMNQKSIRLNCGNGVTYKYMILVAGVDQKDETGTVLLTLKEALMMDALNVKEKILKPRHLISFSGKHPSKNKSQLHSFCVPKSHALLPHKSLEKFACDKISDSTYSQPFFKISPSQKKLCFLQM